MPIEASKAIRRMRGGAQAWLLEAGDGEQYVVKFLENAQHRRVLVNEWLTGNFLKHLELCCPRIELIRCSEDWVAGAHAQGLAIQFGPEQRPVRPGLHFGSKVPVDPATHAIYDYLPDKLLRDVVNRNHFHGMLAFDQWVANADTRQSIYYRGRISEHLFDQPQGSVRAGFIAMMIDHGYAFQGPEWRLDDLPRQGLYPRPAAYEQVSGWDDFEPWLSRITHFPATVVDHALRQIPSAWFQDEDERELQSLLEKLLRRCRRVPDLIEGCRRAKPELFPNWVSGFKAS